MADLIHGNTQVGATKQDLISALTQRELKFNAKLTKYCTDVSQFAVKGAKSISFPRLGSFTPIERASGAAGDAAVITSVVDKLDLNIPAYLAWIVDSNDEVQSTLNWELELAKRAASGHGRFVDTKLIAQAESEGEATTTAGALITRDIILEMREKYLEQEGLLDMASLWIAPAQETALLKISQFADADVFGAPVVRDGKVERLYGVDVVVHNGLSSSAYYLVGKDGLAYGFQKGPQMSSQPANEFGTGAMRTAMDMLFGVKGMQIGEAGAAVGKSALIIKDNN